MRSRRQRRLGSRDVARSDRYGGKFAVFASGLFEWSQSLAEYYEHQLEVKMTLKTVTHNALMGNGDATVQGLSHGLSIR
jgi:hypothetical protein